VAEDDEWLMGSNKKNRKSFPDSSGVGLPGFDWIIELS
jgi:hypothetical protein